MREFFIHGMEKIINAVMLLGAVAVILGGFTVMFDADGGFMMGIGVWLAGGLYLVLMGGAIYLGLGIYYNTKRTADAVERLAPKY